VAIILVPVAFGCAMLAIDYSQLMWERAQVQNGADAAALTLAQRCALQPAACSTANASTKSALQAVNDSNSADNAAGFDNLSGLLPNGVCGVNAGGGLPGCPTPVSNGTPLQCPPLPSFVKSTNSYVEAYTQTLQKDGSSLLPPTFAKLVAGSDGTTVRACARAAWGPAAPSSLAVFPIVMSYCDWATQTGYTAGGTTVYPDAPDYSADPTDGYVTWPTVTEQKIYTKGNPTTCQTWNGHSAPGGFYAINDGNTCTTSVALDGWISGNPGNDNPCKGMKINGATLRGKIVHIPVYDCMYGKNPPATITGSTDCDSGNGSHVNYHIAGYAAFYVTGWKLSGDEEPSIRSGSVPCNGGDRCISGWFTKDLVSEGELVAPDPSGPPNMGLNVVKAAG
jgi:hypothetical protein